MKKRTLLASVALAAVLAACGKTEPAASNAAPVFNPEQATAENATAVDHTVANKEPSQPEKTA